MLRKQVTRLGFTLIELLVVIAIIAVLIALLLPAVQKIRAAAARLQCVNNLKQLALANLSYHDTYKHFSSGGNEDGGAGSGNESWGWGAFILPYVEQTPLYDQLGVGTQTLGTVGASAALRPLSQTQLTIFLCPSDTPYGGFMASSFSGNNFPSGWEAAKSNYVAVAGGLDPGITPNDGIIYLLSQTRIADITDGTSNTFLLGERSSPYGAGTWIGNRNPGGTGTVGSIYTLGVVSQKLNASTPAIWGFSSLHTGGANFALGDGSVRFVFNSISFNNGSVYSNGPSTTSLGGAYATGGLGTYNLAGVRNDGVPLGNDWIGF